MRLISIILELTGISVIGAGIGVEIITGAHLGLVVITAGSCLVAIGGVIWGKFFNKASKQGDKEGK